MSCRHYYDAPLTDGDSVFAVDLSRVAYGPGALDELGAHAKALGLTRVALFTDPRVSALPAGQRARAALWQAGIDLAIYDEVEIEPTDRSILAAAAFVREGSFDGFVSVGGGSVMDTCKAASLYASYPADFLTYVNAPLGAGQAVPGALRPHIACPTTSGTGSECTGIAICTVKSLGVKTGLVHRLLRPTLALIDPRTSHTLPGSVVAASGCDVLCHALESFTARPYNRRPRPRLGEGESRPMSQGANPWSDLGSLEALRLCGRYLLRAIRSAEDHEARDGMMYAAMLAGIAFGNAGVHLPHGMGYAVASGRHQLHMPGYPGEASLVPHGVSVMLSAPAAVRLTAAACPDRHLLGAEALGVETRGVAPEDAGELLSRHLRGLLQAAGMPVRLRDIGYGEADVASLADATEVQRRLLGNAPLPVERAALESLFRQALDYQDFGA